MMKMFDDYDKPAVAVDLVLMTMVDARLNVLIQRRNAEPFAGQWALPGGFVQINESLDDAAHRILKEKARLKNVWIEQLYTFGALERDPRGRVISVTYFALAPTSAFAIAKADKDDLYIAPIEIAWSDETGGPASVVYEGKPAALAFDHERILGMTIKRLRGKLHYTKIAFSLLPTKFTLRDLQIVHEAISGSPLNKPAFRRRMLDTGWLNATGERETASAFRPAELYQLNDKSTSNKGE
ncbi:MAG: NUDIX domain-containing protein [Pseudomonadota bacterium]